MQEATYRGTVYPWHCDHVGHMNVMWYVGKFDEASWNFFARLGLTPSYLRESGRGMAAVEQKVAYKRELLAGDIIEIRSSLLEIREKSIRFQHEMRNAETGEIAARCEFTGVHMDRKLRKSAPFEAAIRNTAMQYLVVAEPGGGRDLRPAAGDAHARHFDRAARGGRGRPGDGLFARLHPAERLCPCGRDHGRP
jgi:acyl-CoA thioester hydrolase